MVYRRAAVGTALGAALVLGPLSSAALAGEEELTILEPAGQSYVTEGESFTVAGEGCPSGSTVRIEGYRETETTTAGEDGSFETTVTMPEIDLPEDVPEAGEWVLKVSCGDRTAGVLLVAVERDALAILQPENRTEVTEGETFVVSGRGCPPGESVSLSGWDGEVTATASAAEDGTWEASVTMPELDLESKTEEFPLYVRCGDEQAAVTLIAVESDDGGDGDGDGNKNGDDKGAGDGTSDGTDDSPDQVAVVPEGGVQTGPGAGSGALAPAAATLIGTLLAAAGSAVLAVRRLRARWFA